MDALHLSNFLSFSMSPLEIFIRGTIMYWFLFLLLRFVLRRDTGSAGISGILFVVLLGDAAQNAMIGNGHTVGDGGLLIATLAGWNLFLDWLGTRVPLVAQLMDAPPIMLVRNGQLLMRNLRREHLTLSEVEAQLRLKGLERMEQVGKMYLESDGRFSVIRTQP
ncbi:MAG TPA: YetF domain-containing protein [Rhodanobacteraceae bacterium]|nr:YetF domain-containing protein [Rhodanobacteraceae bacterium]